MSPRAPRQPALDLPAARERIYVCGEIEDACRAEGLWPVLGTDEAGRGPLAGPVVSAAVVLRDDADLPGLNDSKLLSHEEREALEPLIQQAALAYEVVFASEAEIERRNILGASLWAMGLAVKRVWRQLEEQGAEIPRILLVDGNMPVPGIGRVRQRPVVKGDARSRAIAAASILAKVARDRHMVAADRRYPGYGFAEHKGYSTPQHFEALRRLGPCRIHRRTFAPVAALLREPVTDPEPLL